MGVPDGVFGLIKMIIDGVTGETERTHREKEEENRARLIDAQAKCEIAAAIRQLSSTVARCFSPNTVEVERRAEPLYLGDAVDSGDPADRSADD